MGSSSFDPRSYGLRFGVGSILVGIGAIVWFILEKEHTIKSHGNADYILIIVAIIALYVGVVSLIAVKRMGRSNDKRSTPDM